MHRLLPAAGLAASVIAGAALAQDADYDADTVLATVGDTEITLGHVIVLRDRLPEQYRNIPDDVLMSGLVEQLVDQTLLATDVSAEPEEDPLEVRLHLDNERRGTLAAQVAQEVASGPFDDAEIEAAYEAAYADFEPQTEWNASHILVPDQELAQEIADQIAGDGDFAELAQEHSIDGSAASGGSLGWFGPGQMVPVFEEAVAELETGEVSEPVESDFGWHVIRLDDTRQSSPPPLEQVRGEIEDRLRQEAVQAKIAELRENTEVEIMETEVPPAAIRESDILSN